MDTIRSNIRYIALIICLFSTASLFPFLVDLFYHHQNHKIFLLNAIGGFLLSGGLYLCSKEKAFTSIRDSFLLTFSIWAVAIIFCSLPLYFSHTQLNFIDSIFEATSGLTSCGATIFRDIEIQSHGIKLWRSILNYIGGMGIIVVSMAILPNMNLGGMQLFKTEFTDSGNKLFPGVKEIAYKVLRIYITFTLICVALLLITGLNIFDAITHTMAAISTGGFSNYNDSILHFHDRKIELIIAMTTIFGSIPFSVYFLLRKGNLMSLFKNSQVKLFLKIILYASLACVIWLVMKYNMNFMEAISNSFLGVISIVTTSGFSSYNLEHYGYFPVMVLIIVTIIGGCTGSTAGGIKIFRLQIVSQFIKNQLMFLLQPHAILKVHYQNNVVDNSVINGAITLVLLYFCTLIIGTAALTLDNIDFYTAFTTSVASLSNVGYGMSDIVGSNGSFHNLSSYSKFVISLIMLAGRLEITGILILFQKKYWQN